MDKKKYNNIEKCEKTYEYVRILYLIAWSGYLIWRLYVCIRYCFNYVDDDQAIMWYGTVHMAHGHFSEPCFLGQDYGSMLDSLIAVPLYWCGCPLNIALPFMTMIWGLSPFVLCAVHAMKKRRIRCAWLVLLVAVSCSWQWDVLTSIPRSLTDGFPFAITAFLMLEDSGEKKRNYFLAGLFMSISCVLTASSVALVGLILLHEVVERKKVFVKKMFLFLIFGVLSGLLLIVGIRLFFVLNPDVIMYSGYTGEFDFSILLANIRELPKRFSEYLFCGNAGIVVIPVGGGTCCLVLVLRKKWNLLIIFITAVVGSLFMLALGHSVAYYDNCLLFGQLRMLLFWAYIALLMVMFSAGTSKETDCKVMLRMGILMVTAMSLIIMIKGSLFEMSLKDKNSMIYASNVLSFMRVDDINMNMAVLTEVADATDTDILVCINYARSFAYAAAALCYDEAYVFYVPDTDRRKWVRDEMQICHPNAVLFYALPIDEVDDITIVDIDAMSVTEYFKEVYGIGGDASLIWGVPLELDEGCD